MKTLSKVVDASVIIGSAVVGIGAVRGMMAGGKMKSKATIALSVLTIVIAIYATKQAVTKINE